MTGIHRPHIAQWLINELPMIALVVVGIGYVGMDDMPFTGLALMVSAFLSLCLLYRFLYFRSIRYHFGEEQLICEVGVFHKSINYLELYRVVDFYEHQTLMQQLCGLKTVTIYSMDRSTPCLHILGVNKKLDLVSGLREKVNYNRKRYGIYEISNR